MFDHRITSGDRATNDLAGVRRDGRKPPRRSNASRRRASVYVEVILALPILVIATTAAFEFGLMMLVKAAVTTAAIEGAREGVRVNTSTSDIATMVESILALHHISLSTSGTNNTDGALLTIENGTNPKVQTGNTSIAFTQPNPATLNSNEVRVTVCVLSNFSGNQPVPDWLKVFGFSISGQVLQVSSLQIDE